MEPGVDHTDNPRENNNNNNNNNTPEGTANCKDISPQEDGKAEVPHIVINYISNAKWEPHNFISTAKWQPCGPEKVQLENQVDRKFERKTHGMGGSEESAEPTGKVVSNGQVDESARGNNNNVRTLRRRFSEEVCGWDEEVELPARYLSVCPSCWRDKKACCCEDPEVPENGLQRLKDMDTALKWIKQEIRKLKLLDKSLMAQLLDLRAAVHGLQADGIRPRTASCSSSPETGASKPRTSSHPQSLLRDACMLQFRGRTASLVSERSAYNIKTHKVETEYT